MSDCFPTANHCEHDDLKRQLAEVTAERDQALLNSRAIDEAEFLRRVNATVSERGASSLTPLGKILTGVMGECDRLRAMKTELVAALTRIDTFCGVVTDALPGEIMLEMKALLVLVRIEETNRRKVGL
jgi:hypothetical protein